MRTITFNINEKTKVGKTFLSFIDTFLKGKKGVEIIEEEKTKEEIIEELSKSMKKNITEKYLKEYI